MKYMQRNFNINPLDGISEKQIYIHLGLYSGYVKHVNLIREEIANLAKNKEANAYTISELRRRFSFEFNGMRMHEYYFEQFENNPTKQNENSTLAKLASVKYGSYDAFISHIREVASSRGIGWTIVYIDDITNTLHTVFVSDHEIGQLVGLRVVLTLDLWEHAFMMDYIPAEKTKYIDAFFKNINWHTIEKRITSND